MGWRRLRGLAIWMGLAALTAVVPVRSGICADLATELALQMKAKPSDFILNVPPRPGCLPGSIFTDDLRLPLERTKSDDPALTKGPPFGLEADLGSSTGADAGATFAPIFGFFASHKSTGNTKIRIEDAHLIEILGGDLHRRLLASDAARRAADRGVDPFVVFRAYDGMVSFTLARKQDTSANAWAKVKADAIDVHAGGSLASDDAVVFRLPERIVFAFEVVKATYVANHLGPRPDEVDLEKIQADEFQR
jgi:hypothetical protein